MQNSMVSLDHISMEHIGFTNHFRYQSVSAKLVAPYLCLLVGMCGWSRACLVVVLCVLCVPQRTSLAV